MISRKTHMNQHTQLNQQTQIDLVVQSFIQLSKDLKGKQQDSREKRNKHKNDKQRIINLMTEQKIPYIELDGNYLVISRKNVKPTLSVEFMAQCFMQFHMNPKNTEGNQQEISMRFGDYFFKFQKELSTINHDLKMSRKRPLCAIFQEQHFHNM